LVSEHVFDLLQSELGAVLDCLCEHVEELFELRRIAEHERTSGQVLERLEFELPPAFRVVNLEFLDCFLQLDECALGAFYAWECKRLLVLAHLLHTKQFSHFLLDFCVVSLVHFDG